MNKDRRISLRQRIRQGKIRKEDILRGLAQLAFGRVNDCVRLAIEESPDLETLDLTLLSEVKKTDKGSVEVKMVDRLKVLEQMARMTDDEQQGAEAFLRAMQTEDSQ